MLTTERRTKQLILGARLRNLNIVDDYLNTRSMVLRNLLWAVAVLILLLLLAWQLKVVFVERYSQHADYRHYLVSFCNLVGCQLPPRQDASRVTLVAVKIVPHARHPNAIMVVLKLVNEATFAQPYPILQLTLTDRNGLVVGRRAFSPGEYLSRQQGNLLDSGEFGAVQLDLAHPHEKAVGFTLKVLDRAFSV